MRNRKIQRALKKAGIRREEKLGPRNEEQYYDLTPFEAVPYLYYNLEESE